MAYAVWSVVFGEQPSAAKWNILGTNDAQFNSMIQQNGTGVNILDTNGNELIKGAAVSTAVNELTATNAVTTAAPSLSATGNDTNIGLNLVPKGTGTLQQSGLSVHDGQYDYVATGLVWTADAVGSTRAASMTAGTVVIGGVVVAVAAVTARTFTASFDTYIYVSNAGVITYTTNTLNAASPALPANSILIGIITTGATTIAATTNINQGAATATTPTVSSNLLHVSDSNGVMICNRTPFPTLIGYRQLTGDFTTTSGTAVQITGLSCPVIVPTNRRVKITVYCGVITTTTGGQIIVTAWDGTVASGTQLESGRHQPSTVNVGGPGTLITPPQQATGSKTYNAGLNTTSAGQNATFAANTSLPGFIMVELV